MDCLAPGPVAALAVPAAFRLMLRVEAEMEQRVLVRIATSDDVAAASAVAAARAAARNKLLPSKRKAAIAAVAGFH